jgi:hypothetical protein
VLAIDEILAKGEWAQYTHAQTVVT